MAESFAIAASVITVLDASSKIAKLSKRVVALKDADEAVLEIKEASMCANSVLRHLKDGIARGDQRQPCTALSLIAVAVSPIEKKLFRIDDIVRKVVRPCDGKVDKWRWFRKQQTAAMLLEGLQKDILQLGPLVSTLNMAANEKTQLIRDGAQMETCPEHGMNGFIFDSPEKRHNGKNTNIRFRSSEEVVERSTCAIGEHIAITNSVLCFMGVFLIALSGTSLHCKLPHCVRCRRQIIAFCFRYVLPTWLSARAVVGSIWYERNRGISMRSIRFPMVRPSTARIFEHVAFGDVEAIKIAFSIGEATPWDLDTDGNSLLWVSQIVNHTVSKELTRMQHAMSPLKQNTMEVCQLLRDEGAELLEDSASTPGRLLSSIKYFWQFASEDKVDTEKACRLQFFHPGDHQKEFGASSTWNDHVDKVQQYPQSTRCAPARDAVHWKGWEGHLRDFDCGTEYDGSEQGATHCSETILSGNPTKLAREVFRGDIAMGTVGNTLIIDAVLHNNAVAVEALLSGLVLHDPELILDAQNELGYTALHYAVLYNHYECVELLLRAGADCSIRTSGGYHIGQMAGMTSVIETVETLANAKWLRNIRAAPRPEEDVDLHKIHEKMLPSSRYPVSKEWWMAWEKFSERCGPPACCSTGCFGM